MLRFQNGQFKIMQIADTQEIPQVSPDTMLLLEKAIDWEKPDLVIFTGDQLKGYSRHYKNHPEQAAATIYQLLKPITKRNIPFMVTYGNHDSQCGLSNQEQYALYAQYPSFLPGRLRNRQDVGTADISIFSSDGKKPIFQIYLIDSHGKAADGKGYAPVDREQIKWYRQRREELKKETGNYLPSLVFQHIPVQEFYEVLRQVPRGTKGAVEAYGIRENQFFVLPEREKAHGYFMLESPASPEENTGEFQALREKGEVLGIYVGHDHNNSFVIPYGGIDLGYTQGAGFNVYGPGEKRGVRVFRLSESQPWSYETETLTYGQLCTNKISTPVREFVYRHAPTSPRAVKPILVKAGKTAAAAGAAYILYKLVKNREKK